MTQTFEFRPLFLVGPFFALLGLIVYLVGLLTCHWMDAQDDGLGLWGYCHYTLAVSVPGDYVSLGTAMAILAIICLVGSYVVLAYHLLKNRGQILDHKQQFLVIAVMEVLSGCLVAVFLGILVGEATRGSDDDPVYGFGFSFGLAALGSCFMLIGGIVEIVIVVMHRTYNYQILPHSH
ncbi:uncharacterized protein LOC131930979 [Physella acuta]|uniref:uncharacterized protein LOC131930979 n=1 Tax=Physella acuta TaxID=109671 RepID=UPI0027DD7C70|nr:uncharacterized protein LOC131930979 [Physella acuta]XP_059143632.1 uncharacterized protein LOC131930979 [Physella acuta]XP_059143633.1 uncharacterized protein LOC131930979 [Physella acuta]